MAYKYTCNNSCSADLAQEFKKLPIRQRKKQINLCSPAMEHRLKNILSPFTPPVKEVKGDLKDVLNLLNKCFLINKNVKKNAYTHIEYINDYWYEDTRTDVDYDLRDREYSRKTALIKTAIGLIRYNNLPIDFWKKEWIVYFEHNGKQVSFHDPKEQIICKFKNKNWSWIINKKIPFLFAK